MRKGSFCMLLFLAALVLGGCGKEDQTPEGTEAVILDVPFIDQRIKYPMGCECVSAVMALQGLGYDISVDDFIDSCMVRGELPEDTETGRVGPDPDQVFLGDPYTSQGYGCYAGAIEKGLNRYLEGEKKEARVLRQVPVPELISTYIDAGVPVIFWVGPEQEEAISPDVWIEEETGKTITWNYPEHCMLLVGYDEENYYFNDPSGGKSQAYDRERIEAQYANQFSQAVVIVEKE